MYFYLFFTCRLSAASEPLGGRQDSKVVRYHSPVAHLKDKRLPNVLRACVAALGTQLRMLKAKDLGGDRMLNAWHPSRASVFRSGHDFLARIGFVPQQRSSEDPTAPDGNDWGTARHGLHHQSVRRGPADQAEKQRTARRVPTAPAPWRGRRRSIRRPYRIEAAWFHERSLCHFCWRSAPIRTRTLHSP